MTPICPIISKRAYRRPRRSTFPKRVARREMRLGRSCFSFKHVSVLASSPFPKRLVCVTVLIGSLCFLERKIRHLSKFELLPWAEICCRGLPSTKWLTFIPFASRQNIPDLDSSLRSSLGGVRSRACGVGFDGGGRPWDRNV